MPDNITDTDGRSPLRLMVSVAAVVATFYALATPTVGEMGIGEALDPVRGLYGTARSSSTVSGTIRLAGLGGRASVDYDERGVPHIVAESDSDAVALLGYVVARDRLFQLSFLPRVASGRLAEILGPDLLDADRFLRSTGMELGARRNLSRIEAEGGIERDLLNWYARGANAYIQSVATRDLPFEFRLFGIRPDLVRPIDVLRVVQYMNYDLSYRPVDATRLRFDAAGILERYVDFAQSAATLAPPIVTSLENLDASRGPLSSIHSRGLFATSTTGGEGFNPRCAAATADCSDVMPFAEGLHDGKGSNNWAVTGRRSSSGKALLAGDMHLNLTLPSIWYEASIVTPGMQIYGVTIPGVPMVVEGYTDSLAWAFTNTGADVIDRYRLTLDSTGTRYAYDGGWRPIQFARDTIHVRGGDLVIDTMRFSHHGPISTTAGAPVATRWVGHETNRVIAAGWGMGHSHNRAEFEEATEVWDSPMQNILLADKNGVVSLRSTGFVPVRRNGTGAGLLDGSTSQTEWEGRIPFDELPATGPIVDGFVTSTNQRPVGPSYPYYLAESWNSVFRSIRIQALLSGSENLSSVDMERFQRDVYSVQADLLIPFLSAVPLSATATPFADRLANWDREMSTDSDAASLFASWLSELQSLTWDEDVFAGVEKPHVGALIALMKDEPESKWFDVVATPQIETADDIIARSFERSIETRKPGTTGQTEWGREHQILFRHITRSDRLRPLFRGPFPYPGYDETLSPGAGSTVTMSASWRMVVDLSTDPPSAFGVYPGGQSGNPFSPNYDNGIPTYLAFNYFPLRRICEDPVATVLFLPID